MSNLVSGRQLRAARALAGLTQAQLSEAAGFNPRACKYWEANGDKPPSNLQWTILKIEDALARRGVIVFADPAPGARISEIYAQKA